MKKVVWDAPLLQNPNSPFLKGRKTFKQMWEAGQKLDAEQQEAQAYLMKAMPVMQTLLKIKLENGTPLVVMRPLRYQTSEIVKGDAIDDAFYRGASQTERVNDKFTDVIKTIMPGTTLVLKSLDMGLQEFVFVDGLGKEHSMSFDERNNLMTQTNIFEEVKNLMETKGE